MEKKKKTQTNLLEKEIKARNIILISSLYKQKP